MNVFHKVALQGLRRNRTRTFVTVVGVALSAALITAVATFVVSLQTYMVNGAIAKYGDWQVAFVDVDSPFAQEQAKDPRVAKVVSFENIGYAMLDGGKNPDKPYWFIAGFRDEAYSALPLQLLSGRLPENGTEVLVPAHAAANGGVRIALGDTLSLAVGTRRAGAESLCQHDPYRSGEETLSQTTEKTYTVVGIYQRPPFEEHSAPGYTLITTADAENPSGRLCAFVTLEKPEQIHAYVKDVAAGRASIKNDEVLRFLGLSDDTLFRSLLYSAGGILIALVMLGSVFLIYNAFHIALNERTHQLGILMSVGATEKQLRNAVLFEALCIGAMGIPLGILVGIPSIQLVLSLVAVNFANVLYGNVPLTLVLSAPALAVAAAVSLATLLVSAYLPARKAARTPVLDCIRQTDALQVEAKAIRTAALTERLFGVEGTLAVKTFQRNKRRYRSILLSLTLSVVLFVSSSAFGENLKQVAEEAKVVTDYDIGLSVQALDEQAFYALFDQLKTTEGVTKASYQAVLEYSCAVQADDLAGEFRQAAGEPQSNGTVALPVDIQFLDDQAYLQILQELGLPVGEYTGEHARLLAVAKMEDATGQAEEVRQLPDLFASASLEVSVFPKVNGQSVPERGRTVGITCVERTLPDTPPYTGAPADRPYVFQIIAPWSLKEAFAPAGLSVDSKVEGLTFQSETPSRSAEQMQALLDGTGLSADCTLYNVDAMMEQNRNLLFIVNLFTVVFVLMISLIAVANVFNTISTNIKLRRRELAMLRSVGMSDRGFQKMMCLECALYGLRTLLFGLPLAGGLSWLIHCGMVAGGAHVVYQFPWESMAVSVLGVFLVIFIAMLYAASKIKRENIIDALRDDLE